MGGIESASELGLTDRLTIAKLAQPDLLEGVGAQAGESLGRAGFGDHRVAESENLGSIVAVMEFAAPISAQMPGKNPRSCKLARKTVS